MKFTARRGYIDERFWEPDQIWPDDVHVDAFNGHDMAAEFLLEWQTAIEEFWYAYKRVRVFSRRFARACGKADIDY